MKTKLRITTVMFVLVITVSVMGGAAVPLTAAAIIGRMNAVANGIEDLNAIITVQNYKNGVVAITQRMKLALQQPNRMRLEYLAPDYLAGNVTLIIGDKMWMYIAALDKWFTKDLSALSPTEQPWLMFRNILRGVRSELDDYAFIRLADEGNAYHIRGRPADAAAVYGRIDLWVNKDTFVPIRRVVYDQDGVLLADARFLDATEVAAGITLPLRIETYGSTGKLETAIAYDKVAVNAAIPAGLFTPPEPSDD